MFINQCFCIFPCPLETIYLCSFCSESGGLICSLMGDVPKTQITQNIPWMVTLQSSWGLFHLKLHPLQAIHPLLSFFPPIILLTSVYVFLMGTVSPMTIGNDTGHFGGTLRQTNCSFERHLKIKQTKNPTVQKLA